MKEYKIFWADLHANDPMRPKRGCDIRDRWLQDFANLLDRITLGLLFNNWSEFPIYHITTESYHLSWVAQFPVSLAQSILSVFFRVHVLAANMSRLEW